MFVYGVLFIISYFSKFGFGKLVLKPNELCAHVMSRKYAANDKLLNLWDCHIEMVFLVNRIFIFCDD